MNCRLCGGNDLHFFYAGGNKGQFKYYRCGDCRLVNYDLTTGYDQEKYSEQYISPVDNTGKANRDQTDSYYYLRQFITPPGTMLDIGCYNARILFLARQEGWQVQGLDLSPEIAERVKDDVGIDIRVQDFLEHEPVEKYDVVILRHVLEHLIDPIMAMTKIRQLLNDDGTALIEIPNIDGLSKRFNRALKRLGLKKGKRHSDGRKPGHVNEYARYSFHRLADQTGFKVIDWRTYSSSPVSSFFYRYLGIGNKARALITPA